MQERNAEMLETLESDILAEIAEFDRTLDIGEFESGLSRSEVVQFLEGM